MPHVCSFTGDRSATYDGCFQMIDVSLFTCQPVVNTSDGALPSRTYFNLF